MKQLLIVLPAVLIVGEHIALVLDAGNAVDVAVARGEHLIGAVLRLAAPLCVFRPVVPQQGHHHLTYNNTTHTPKIIISV